MLLLVNPAIEARRFIELRHALPDSEPVSGEPAYPSLMVIGSEADNMTRSAFTWTRAVPALFEPGPDPGLALELPEASPWELSTTAIGHYQLSDASPGVRTSCRTTRRVRLWRMAAQGWQVIRSCWPPPATSCLNLTSPACACNDCPPDRKPRRYGLCRPIKTSCPITVFSIKNRFGVLLNTVWSRRLAGFERVRIGASNNHANSESLINRQ
ncbi:hypothetical protein [Methylomonas koyamae]|uniref:hypothetical protein n=1 Tax=Methylomonas koyamae TaxID=702114 RepID=UPI000B0E36E3|nr:hypothetical protein [Methylomonas koyamae]